jgi:levoglucosan dehydrogenase
VTRTDELRVGIVGAGYIAGIHSAAYRVVSGTYDEVPRRVTLAAVSDADLGRAEALATAWGWERQEPDWRAVTRAPDIDVVDVAVPNAVHAEVAIDALRHGKHVICEKPLADDVAGAMAMCDAADDARRVAQVCFYYRLWPAIAWARELVDSGAIGTPQHFRGWMLQDYAADPTHDLGWRARRGEAGGGALADLGSHIVDIARHLCGDIVNVCATARSTVSRSGAIDDLTAMFVEFDGGASGLLEAGWALRGHTCDLGFDLVGDRGAIRFTWERSNEIQVLTTEPGDRPAGFQRIMIGGQQPDAHRFVGVAGQGIGYRDAFAVGIGHALTAITRGDVAAGPSFQDGLRVAQVVEAALRSAAERAWISLPQLSHIETTTAPGASSLLSGQRTSATAPC